MARFWRQTVEVESLLPERVLGLLDLCPGHLVVGDGAHVAVQDLALQHLGGDTEVVGPDIGVAADDDVRHVGRCLRPLAVHDEVLAVLDRLRYVAVGVHATGVGEEWDVVMSLFVEGNAGVGAEHHEGGAGLAELAGHDLIHLVAHSSGGGVQQPLQVDLRPALQGELPVVGNPRVVQLLAELLGHFGDDGDVVLAVEYRLNAVLAPDLEEGI